ncbi:MULTISPECIES: DUF2145 domain-containing protein [unclassified Massilia]|uniref:DUF2145 domain-containing protein n=1 Tax=unclassified Massilia TaxID=2609279 RepID=UPI0017861B7D|nr:MULTISPECIES: DUF2145 domain-containing protein [unclassified Massilia]MBD8533343.1 DUF2145 domain-containing protein [Massilia sp. CFBP 13647]MBD8676736.1 DUF2145 domain-containing protein [Massilia sp. CFBP 13721]
MRVRFRLGAVPLALALCASSGAWAGLPTFCERASEISAAEQDRVLRFAGVVKRELEQSGARVALVARAGTDLSRFGLLYSHAAVALKDNPAAPWAVRQLYYACDESRPRLFDQGVAGFALGADTPASGHMSLVFLPEPDGALLERAALDKPLALSLLAGEYSANAYAFGTRYQNCNGWVAELLAGAWGHLGSAAAPRAQAQAWLRTQGYTAGPVRIPSHAMMFAGQFVPLLHVNDHPVEDIHQLALQVSVPESIEAFVHARAPAARRVELCHDRERIVVRRGWQPIGAQCRALPGDEVIAFASAP